MKRGPTLHDAAKDNNSALAFDLLRIGWSKDGHNEEKQTPLHVACASGSTDVARVLIEYKANLFATDSNGNTPIMIAKASRHKELVRLLVEQGVRCPADVPLKALGLPEDLSALHFAVKARNAVSLRKEIDLISDECGDDIDKYFESLNVRDKLGLTPLHLAAQLGHHDCVFELASEEINTDLQDRYGRTPLHLAITGGYEKCALIIIHWSKNVDIADQWQHTPLFYALRLRNENLIKALVLKGAATENLLELAEQMQCLDVMTQEKAVEENPAKEDAVKLLTPQFENLVLQKKLSQEKLLQDAVMELEEDKAAVLDSQSEQNLSSDSATKAVVTGNAEQELAPSSNGTSQGPRSTSRQNKKKKKVGGK